MKTQKKSYAEQLHDRLKHTKIEYVREIPEKQEFDIPAIKKAARAAFRTFSHEELLARGFYPQDYQ